MYAKLFSRITESSLMEEPVETRYIFMTLLAIADPKGFVIGTDIALARRINISLLEFEAGMARLMAADPNSNSQEHEGRRIVKSDCERGYLIVNYLTYRNYRDEDHRREYMRQLMADKRKKQRSVSNVSSVSNCKQPLAQAEAEAEAQAEAEAEAEKEKTKIRLRLGQIFNRKETTRWSQKEIKALKLIGPIEETDLRLVEAYYAACHDPKFDCRRRDLLTLLNNFQGEVDRARRYKPKTTDRDYSKF